MGKNLSTVSGKITAISIKTYCNSVFKKKCLVLVCNALTMSEITQMTYGNNFMFVKGAEEKSIRRLRPF